MTIDVTEEELAYLLVACCELDCTRPSCTAYAKMQEPLADKLRRYSWELHFKKMQKALSCKNCGGKNLKIEAAEITCRDCGYQGDS